jgi:ketosteroid isomerase-like protein
MKLFSNQCPNDNEGIVMKKLMTLVFVLLAAGCMQAPQTDLEGLKATQDVWQSAYDAEDSAALAALYAEDAALMPPNNNSVIGRAAIEVFWADFKASGVGIEIQDTEVYAQGDDGYTVGAYTASDASGATVDEGKYVVIWRHVDGKWQNLYDIWNSNLPLGTLEPELEPEPEDEAEVADEV